MFVTVLMYRVHVDCLHFMCVHVVTLKEQILHKSINIISSSSNKQWYSFDVVVALKRADLLVVALKRADVLEV